MLEKHAKNACDLDVFLSNKKSTKKRKKTENFFNFFSKTPCQNQKNSL